MTDFLPLRKLRVLDFSQNLPGPVLTRLLADLGAEVIKLEPLQGEGLRWMPPHIKGIGATFGGLNAGKKSLAVNLKKAEGATFVRALVAHVDVVVESFRPGKLAALGLGAEELMELNPRLIVCSLSGYGQSGSMANVAGHDVNFLARAGVLGLTGPADAPPTMPGVQVADVGGGSLSGAVGILAALLEREHTGRGRHLDISLMRSSAAFGAVAFAGMASGYVERRGDGFLSGGLPSYRCYEAADGRYMALGALEPQFFAKFCKLVGRGELAARGYARGSEARAVIAEMTQIFKSRTSLEWLDFCAGQDVCLSLVRTPGEAMDDPELGAVIRNVDGFTVVSPHVGVNPPLPERGPSELGADCAQLISELQIEHELVRAAVDAGALLGMDADWSDDG